MALAHRKVRLNNGVEMPVVGLGTWQSKRGQVAQAVEVALNSGYRHIDGAFAYQNESEVGQGIKRSGVPREQLFLTTKLWSTWHSRVEECLDQSLSKLGTTYVDLYLMHWPVALNPNGNNPFFPTLPSGKRDLQADWTFLDTWSQMEALLSTGKVKAIGVSNFSTINLDLLLKNCKIVPAVNQVELHPLLPQDHLHQYCQQRGIHLTAYSPLGSTNSPLLTHPTLLSISQKNGKSIPQTLLSWGLSKGFSVLPKSVTPERIRENIQVYELPKEDVERIDKSVKERRRFVKPDWGVEVFHDDDWYKL